MAKIYYLIRCSVCNKRIKDHESFTEWEKAHYCEPCFDQYMELIDPADFILNNEGLEEERKKKRD